MDEYDDEGNPTGETVDSGLELQALEDPDQKVDPGWITVGKYEACDTAGCTGEFLSPEAGDSGVTYKDGGDNVVRLIGDDKTEYNGSLQSFFSCTNCDNDSKGEGAEWSLTPDAGIPERFDAVSGQDDKSFFDAFSLVLKGGTYYTAYLFTAAQLGITDLGTVYNFSGTFNMPTFDGNPSQPGLSHITVLAHDPASSSTTTPVPEPGVLWLMGFGLIGLAGFARINAGRRASSSMQR